MTVFLPFRVKPGRYKHVAGVEPYCVLAYEAVDLLHAAGRRAWQLHEGMLEWRLRGLAVEAA